MRLTARDEELLQTLMGRVRLLTLELAAHLWRTSKVYASRRLTQLESAALIARTRVLAHPMLELEAPVATWSPGHPAPEFGAVSYRLQARWTRSVRPTEVIFASARAMQILGPLLGGAGGKLDYPLQVTHDMHVARIYVGLRDRDPEEARMWQGEELLRRERKKGKGKVCDAALVEVRPGGKERLVRAIEFGGSYRPDRVRAFHRVMENRRLAYELW